MGFWEGLLKFGSFLDSVSGNNDLQKYKDELYNAFANNENKLFGNFSREGFDAIFEILIGNASESVTIFCKNYNVIFNDSNILLLNYIADQFKRTKGEIGLYTFDGSISKELKDLEGQYSSVKYIPCKIDLSGKRISNMIIVDHKRYWQEDLIYDRNTLDDPFKACVNFNDLRKCLELIKFIHDFRMKYEIIN